MRLIDADKIDFNEVFKGQSEFAKDTRDAAQSLVDAQKTAYNPNKVVKQLENLKDTMGYRTGCKTILKRAIELVKGGGVNE